jgi:hypothetical protein
LLFIQVQDKTVLTDTLCSLYSLCPALYANSCQYGHLYFGETHQFLDLTCKVGGTRCKIADHIETSLIVFGWLTNLPVMDFTMIEVTNP